MGQAGLRHLAGPNPAGAEVGHRPVRLPGRHARQRDGLVAARFPAVQRHERASLSGGRGSDFPATVTVNTEPTWLVATGHAGGPAAARAHYRDGQLPRPGRHAVLHRPVRLSTARRWTAMWTRLATYPAGALTGAGSPARSWDQIGKMIPADVRGVPGDAVEHYTVMMIFDSSYGGGSALEHQNSHVGIYAPAFIGNAAPRVDHRARDLPRLEREAAPAGGHGAVPLRSARAHALALGERGHHRLLRRPRAGSRRHHRRRRVSARSPPEDRAAWPTVAPTALEDASLSTWIHPTDGTEYIYYHKGSLAGFLLDIMIRDASDNRRSLDDVMRELYRTDLQARPRLHGADWWAAVAEAAGGQVVHRIRREVRGRPGALPMGAGAATGRDPDGLRHDP